MGKHAAFGPATGARGINDAGGIFELPRNESGIAFAAEIFPAERARQLGAGWGLRQPERFQLSGS